VPQQAAHGLEQIRSGNGQMISEISMAAGLPAYFLIPDFCISQITDYPLMITID